MLDVSTCSALTVTPASDVFAVYMYVLLCVDCSSLSNVLLCVLVCNDDFLTLCFVGVHTSRRMTGKSFSPGE